MDKLKTLLHELGISKVDFAKYLGVSRQMVYNYLEMESINEWPKDKKLKVFELLGINDLDDIKELKATSNYILEVEERLNKTNLKKQKIDNNGPKLGKREDDLLNNLILLAREKLADKKSKDAFHEVEYLYHYLQATETSPELKYILGFFSKLTGFTELEKFVFDKEKQIVMESIMYSAILMYNNGGLSKSKVMQSRDRFVKEIEQKNEERLSRTQELNTVKIQALKELGYTELNEKNANEVFAKIAEIQSRKV